MSTNKKLNKSVTSKRYRKQSISQST